MKWFAVAAVVLLAAFALQADPAPAHPLPKGTSVTIGLHKICKTLLICRDYAPRPKIKCAWNNRGQREVIYDPKLDANVTWRCDCPWGKYGNCLWVRVMIQPVPADYLIPPNKHVVWDWQRRCAALVCLKTKVDHLYHSLRFYPDTAA